MIPLTVEEIKEFCALAIGRPFSVVYADGDVFSYRWTNVYGGKYQPIGTRIGHRCLRCGTVTVHQCNAH